jgi:hypothetical protein
LSLDVFNSSALDVIFAGFGRAAQSGIRFGITVVVVIIVDGVEYKVLLKRLACNFCAAAVDELNGEKICEE